MRTMTTPEQQGFRDFDLPKEHLLDQYHYVPPKAHDPAEIARRRELNRGTLIAEEQHRGLRVARTILEELSEQEGRIFAAETIAIAGLNSAWYSYAQRSSDVMRRRLKLPIMLHKRNRIPADLMADSIGLLASAESKANKLIYDLEGQPDKVDETQREVGVRTGNAALHLAVYPSVVRGEFPEPQDEEVVSDWKMQQRVRDIGLVTLYDARTFYREAGTHPGLAQLADPYSDLAVYWHRNAPGSAQRAVLDALAA